VHFFLVEGKVVKNMKVANIITAGAILMTMSGCAAGTHAPQTPVAQETQQSQSYVASATVGDFLTFTLDPANKTFTYNDLTNSEQATLPLVETSTNVYGINDPSGNMVAAYQYPNYGLVVEAKKVGPDRDTVALNLALAKTPVSIADVTSQPFNCLQLRTSQGGFELGSATIDGQGNIKSSTYWPLGAAAGGTSFHNGTFPASSVDADPSGNFLKITDEDDNVSYLFGGASEFVIDRPDGTMLGFAKAATKDFDAVHAGTYQTNAYQKLGAANGQSTVETGVPGFDNGTVTVGTDGTVTFVNGQGKVVAQGTLVAVADDPAIYGGGFLSLQDPCFGLFTLHVTTATSQQDIFVSFGTQSVAFASLTTTLPQDPSNTYNYFYGIGVKQ
jgi:hypothetical protein